MFQICSITIKNIHIVEPRYIVTNEMTFKRRQPNEDQINVDSIIGLLAETIVEFLCRNLVICNLRLTDVYLTLKNTSETSRQEGSVLILTIGPTYKEEAEELKAKINDSEFFGSIDSAIRSDGLSVDSISNTGKQRNKP